MATRIVRYLCDFCEEEFHYECEAAEHEEICPFRAPKALQLYKYIIITDSYKDH